jgi:signal peptidase I
MGFCYLSEDYDAHIVLSDSMQPMINSGDLVLVGRPNHPFVDEIKPETHWLPKEMPWRVRILGQSPAFTM